MGVNEATRIGLSDNFGEDVAGAVGSGYEWRQGQVYGVGDRLCCPGRFQLFCQTEFRQARVELFPQADCCDLGRRLRLRSVPAGMPSF